jgi:quercetin dioxygenase-like cupin family protein
MHHRCIEVLGMSTPAYRFPSGKELTRMPYLASPLMRTVVEAWYWPEFEDPGEIPHIVLLLMKANTRMNKHHVDARISIQALEGRLRVRLPDQMVELPAGELIALDYAIPHSVEALEESAFLITISWPGGSKEERHAWKRSIS